MSNKPIILVSEPYGESAMQALREAGEVRTLDSCEPEMLEPAIADADALLIRTYTQVTEDLLAKAPKLKVIGRAGVGLENVDISAAKRKNIAVINTPAAATHSVAELAIGLMISLERKIAVADTDLREGYFVRARKESIGREFYGKTLGIIGMGRIGTCVGRIASLGMGMTVQYHDIQDVGPFDFPATATSREQVLSESDVISLHVPLTDLTRNMIDQAALELMKPETTLINTSRGAVIDLHALADALMYRKIAGAATDVFSPEPLPADHPILSAPNTLLTPHIGARTPEGQSRMEDVVHEVIRILNNQTK